MKPPQSAADVLSGSDIRDAFFDEVYRSAEVDPNVIVLSDDQGAFSLNKLRENRPSQYINLGIAEQNAIDLAAGMALGGMRPIVYGITNFVSLRCAEQISVSLCLMGLPVTIVASGGGLTYASDGPTHHATQDIAVLRSMPGMTIYNPADAAATAAAARFSLTANGPCYVRIEKGILPQLYFADHDFSRGFEMLRVGGDLLIISTGYGVHEAMTFADLLLARGVKAGVIDLYRLKPVNDTAMQESLKTTRHVITIEEQSPVGGIGDIIAGLIAETGLGIKLSRFSLPDEPCFRYGSRLWLQDKHGLAAEHLLRKYLSLRPDRS